MRKPSGWWRSAPVASAALGRVLPCRRLAPRLISVAPARAVGARGPASPTHPPTHLPRVVASGNEPEEWSHMAGARKAVVRPVATRLMPRFLEHAPVGSRPEHWTLATSFCQRTRARTVSAPLHADTGFTLASGCSRAGGLGAKDPWYSSADAFDPGVTVHSRARSSVGRVGRWGRIAYEFPSVRPGDPLLCRAPCQPSSRCVRRRQRRDRVAAS